MHESFWSSTWGWAIKLSAWVVTFLAPVKATVFAVLFLVLSDLVTGIWAAIKRKEKFTSAKLRQTPVKLIGYLAAVILAFVTESVLLPEIPIVKVVAGLLASVELTSALENLSSITGTPMDELVKKLFNKKDAPPDA